MVIGELNKLILDEFKINTNKYNFKLIYGGRIMQDDHPIGYYVDNGALVQVFTIEKIL